MTVTALTVLAYNREELAAVGSALHKMAEQALDRARKSLGADFLTAHELKEQVDYDLHEIATAAAALDQVWPEVAGTLAGEATTLRAEFARVERELLQNEREVASWNARAEALNRGETAATTSGDMKPHGVKIIGVWSGQAGEYKDSLTATPAFKHNRTECEFLGGYTYQGERWDLYFCNQSGAGVPTIIARWGNNPEEYQSGYNWAQACALAFDPEKRLSPMAEAYWRHAAREAAAEQAAAH